VTAPPPPNLNAIVTDFNSNASSGGECSAGLAGGNAHRTAAHGLVRPSTRNEARERRDVGRGCACRSGGRAEWSRAN
jgi:hypothetical protein